MNNFTSPSKFYRGSIDYISPQNRKEWIKFYLYFPIAFFIYYKMEVKHYFLMKKYEFR